MGKNIFEIERDLQNTLDAIEEAGGELTEETLVALEINEENFKDKIDSYCQVITKYKSEDACCKEEKSRISDIQKTKKNVIDRLKKTLLDAVLKFGNDVKSGNKVIETATHKLFTKNTESFEVIDARLTTLYSEFMEYMQEVYEQGLLALGEQMDIPVVLNCVNKIIKDKSNSNYVEFGDNPPVEGGAGTNITPFTVQDLKATQLDITFSTSLYDLFTKYDNLVLAMFKHPIFPDVKLYVNDKFIEILKSMGNDAISKCTLGTPVQKQSLTIK